MIFIPFIPLSIKIITFMLNKQTLSRHHLLLYLLYCSSNCWHMRAIRPDFTPTQSRCRQKTDKHFEQATDSKLNLFNLINVIIDCFHISMIRQYYLIFNIKQSTTKR